MTVKESPPVRERISAAYLSTQVWLHGQPEGYGGRGKKHALRVVNTLDEFGARTMLDYACGQGTLGRAVRERRPAVEVTDYDPAVPQFAHEPKGHFDIVTCTDMLEHVEPAKLNVVLSHLHHLARFAVWGVIATRPANKVLPDGTNAHLIVEPGAWWRPRMHQFFELTEWDDAGHEVFFCGVPCSIRMMKE